MRAFKHFSIPIKGLKNGTHQFEYVADKDFFSSFENDVIQDGKIDVILDLDKKSDHLELVFSFSGHMKTDCDRCTATISLPMESQHTLMVKYDSLEEKMDDEVWYITHDTQQINMAKIIYEFIALSIPMVKTYDCESESKPPCNMEIKRRLNGEDQEENVDGENPFAKVLKNIKLN